ncbi:hypothetical protein EYF80_032513 [Liparis tanakae]|uniref:Uncharacterized protein n=1 Tax=Liparis tanakae TaxID=230148 RepID=A0A4Z2GXC7_9TELE|nr:hypothetical protein EYF80_032513 [Liparis tanakae]
MRVQDLLFSVEETFNPAPRLLLNKTSYALTEFSTNFLWYYTQLASVGSMKRSLLFDWSCAKQGLRYIRFQLTTVHQGRPQR